MRLQWTTLALEDLQSIHAYISEDSPKTATSVLSAIRRAIRGQLQSSPLAGRVGRVPGTRELVVPRLPFIIAYRVTEKQIEILRVFHTARQWPSSL